MIKIVHIGDLHLGGNYPDKAAASIRFILEQMADPNSPAHNPDMVICTGDTTEKPLHVHNDQLRPLLDLINQVEAPMIFLQGTPSHEPYGFLHNVRHATGNVITVYDSPKVEIAPLTDWSHRAFLIRDDKIAIATLPALNKPKLWEWAEQLGLPAEDPGEIIRDIMRWISEQWKDFSGPKILLGHWTVNGCSTASGQTLFASDLAIGTDDIALSGANVALLGHIHKAQNWERNDETGSQYISYCGSSYPCNWGELDSKSFAVYEMIERPKTFAINSVKRIAFPHKPMIKVDIEYTGKQQEGAWEWQYIGDPWPTAPLEAEVKACYAVPKAIAPQISDIDVRFEFSKMGIELSAIERKTLATERDQIDGIALKESTRSQYEASCAAKGEEPRPGSLELADQMDTEGVGR